MTSERSAVWAVFDEEVLRERSGDVAVVTDKLANEAADQTRDRLPIIHIARRQAKGKQFATVIDDQVQLEAVELADRGLTAARIDRENAMLVDPGVRQTANAVESMKLMPLQ
jgi:hypothetical protein